MQLEERLSAARAGLARLGEEAGELTQARLQLESDVDTHAKTLRSLWTQADSFGEDVADEIAAVEAQRAAVTQRLALTLQKLADNRQRRDAVQATIAALEMDRAVAEHAALAAEGAAIGAEYERAAAAFLAADIKLRQALQRYDSLADKLVRAGRNPQGTRPRRPLTVGDLAHVHHVLGNAGPETALQAARKRLADPVGL